MQRVRIFGLMAGLTVLVVGFGAWFGGSNGAVMFFVLAAAEALKAYPIINATVDGESIVYPDHENVSIAVDTERGLLGGQPQQQRRLAQHERQQEQNQSRVAEQSRQRAHDHRSR